MAESDPHASWRTPEIRAAKRADFGPFVVAAVALIVAIVVVAVALLT